MSAEGHYSICTVLGDEVATFNGDVRTMTEAVDEMSCLLGIPLVVWDGDQEAEGER